MNTELIIAEKPSVAGDIAAALGGFTRGDGFFEKPGCIITFARGHLVEIGINKETDPGFNLAALPVLPSPFLLGPIHGCEKLLTTIERLANRPDVTKVVNACDAGREGELIFRLIIGFLGIRKPTERVWLQTMTPTGIRTALTNRRSDAQMRPLADAARSRSEADWLVGINATRVMTLCGAVQVEKGHVVSAGRVQTPTLALVVNREDEINGFVSETFYEVMGTFGVTDGTWPAKLIRQDGEHKGSTRFADRAQAQQVVQRCEGKVVDEITETTTRQRRNAPLPFDLTTLQRVANVRFGYPAAKTLDIAQALYEKHKVTTYPRTDSSHLPSDYPPKVQAIMKALPARFQAFGQEVLNEGWAKAGHPVFNDAKISDHFAIIPTGNVPANLSEHEEAIYNLVVRRFIAAFYPAAEFDKTTRDAWIGSDMFRASGLVQVSAGWMKVYDDADEEASRPKKKSKTDEDDAQGKLPRMSKGEVASLQKLELKTGKTKPPPRYTEASLLGAMETAGKLVDDEEMSKAMKERGLGTPATRAAVIEDLLSVRKGYLTRKGKELRPTQKAADLIAALRRYGIEFLASPELTGEWEHKLAMMEEGKLSRDDYMREIRESVQRMVTRVRGT